MTPSRVLIITGMHRSGTSLTASWLQSCGLNIGTQLIGATRSNVLGHFEDVDIVEFHERLLKSNQTTLYAGEGIDLIYTDSHLEEAQQLVAARNQKASQWGWKQPRATLFLSLWRQVLPTANYLLLFRNFEQTVASLYYRELEKLGYKNPGEKGKRLQMEFESRKQDICNQYLSMWIRHNKEVLDHLDHLPGESSLLLSIDTLIQNDHSVLNYLVNNWGFDLSFQEIHNIYKPSLLKQLVITEFDPVLHKNAEAILHKLEKWNDNGLVRLGTS